MATPAVTSGTPAPAAAPDTTTATGNSGLSGNVQEAIVQMQQQTRDGAALQLADFELQRVIQPLKKLAQAAKDALG
jgi:hypothetical protein